MVDSMKTQIDQFDVAERRREKQEMWENDECRLRSGEAKPAQILAQNGFFSVLDPSKAQIVSRRVRLATT